MDIDKLTSAEYELKRYLKAAQLSLETRMDIANVVALIEKIRLSIPDKVENADYESAYNEGYKDGLRGQQKGN